LLRQRLRPTLERALEDLEDLKTKSFVDSDSVRLCVHDDTDAAHRFGHVSCNLESRAQEQFADAAALRRPIDRETRETENRQGVVR